VQNDRKKKIVRGRWRKEKVSWTEGSHYFKPWNFSNGSRDDERRGDIKGREKRRGEND